MGILKSRCGAALALLLCIIALPAPAEAQDGAPADLVERRLFVETPTGAVSGILARELIITALTGVESIAIVETHEAADAFLAISFGTGTGSGMTAGAVFTDALFPERSATLDFPVGGADARGIASTLAGPLADAAGRILPRIEQRVRNEITERIVEELEYRSGAKLATVRIAGVPGTALAFGDGRRFELPDDGLLALEKEIEGSSLVFRATRYGWYPVDMDVFIETGGADLRLDQKAVPSTGLHLMYGFPFFLYPEFETRLPVRGLFLTVEIDTNRLMTSFSPIVVTWLQPEIGILRELGDPASGWRFFLGGSVLSRLDLGDGISPWLPAGARFKAAVELSFGRSFGFRAEWRPLVAFFSRFISPEVAQADGVVPVAPPDGIAYDNRFQAFPSLRLFGKDAPSYLFPMEYYLGGTVRF
ncbi:MAG: hypothetical protein NT080_10105 [Spirochaetes bacterium]|nr:hypothetical protein [Spirochaetota bacterium]